MTQLFSFRRLIVLVVLLPAGCSGPEADISDAATRQQLALLMPTTINIVGPFTRFRSFNGDERPDGIELLVQPVNAFGDPVNIAGAIIVELYEFRQASGDCKGAKLKQWDIPLTREDEQRRYWNRTTCMYEFRLQVDPQALPAGQKYVLQVTYNTPLKEHMVDQHVVEAAAATPALAGAGG